MPCLLALVVLSVLGIFSASHRKLAKEAFDCVFRRITLRPCTTGFDTKVKAAILGKLINRSQKLAKFVSKYFEVLAWGFVIIFTVSTVWTARGIYNYWAWGDCNGQTSGGFCAFDPTGSNNKVSATEGDCVDSKLAVKALNLKSLNLADYPTIQANPAGNTKQIVFIGCYNCDYTRKTWPAIQKLTAKEAATLVFIHFPVKPETKYLMAYDACVYRENPAVYWQLVDRLFGEDKPLNADETRVQAIISALGMDIEKVKACVNLPETQAEAEQRYKAIQKTGLYGTPTVFINGTPVVGPKPERVYRRLLNKSLI